MALGNLLPEFLQRSDGADDGVLRECRHCGSKFDEPVDRCRVCDSTEIATYEFVNDSSAAEGEAETESEPDGQQDGTPDAPAADRADDAGNHPDHDPGADHERPENGADPERGDDRS